MSTSEERIEAIKEAMRAAQYACILAGETNSTCKVVLAAIATADATRPKPIVTGTMIQAFRDHIEADHSLCEKYEDCCIKEGIQAALKVMK